MIDYLERLFRPEGGNDGFPAPGRGRIPEMGTSSVAWGRQASVPSVELEEGKLPQLPGLSVRAGRQVEFAVPEVERGERVSFFAPEVSPDESISDPVKKLRRDSRRYDSGFYWY